MGRLHDLATDSKAGPQTFTRMRDSPSASTRVRKFGTHAASLRSGSWASIRARTVKPYCPPHYASIEEAVHAFVDSKYAPGKSVFRDGSDASAVKDTVAFAAGIDEYSEAKIDAAVPYSEYVHSRYGRFLGNFGPLRSLIAYQAHHI
jgi:hypothetical protein